MSDEHDDRFAKLPERVDATDFVIEIPSFEDDRPAPDPIPPAAAPDLVAATQIAQGSGGAPRTIRRTQFAAGLVIAGVPIGIMIVIAVVEILMAR